MQTDIWMAFSDSTHFSEQLSYKILFISSYSLKDKNFASLDHFPAILKKKQEWVWACLTERLLAIDNDARGQVRRWDADEAGDAEVATG
jgi:hypothetical protein